MFIVQIALSDLSFILLLIYKSRKRHLVSVKTVPIFNNKRQVCGHYASGFGERRMLFIHLLSIFCKRIVSIKTYLRPD